MFERRVKEAVRVLGVELRRVRGGNWVISREGRDLAAFPSGDPARVVFYLLGFQAGLEQGKKMSGPQGGKVVG